MGPSSDPLGAGSRGRKRTTALCRRAQGWLPRCLIPCAHWWLHAKHQGPQWWPTALSVDGQRHCAAGAQGRPSECPIPCTHSPFQVGALLAHWESDLPAEPPVGSIGLLDGRCSCCAQWQCRGTLGRAGGTTGGVGGTWAPLVLVWGLGWGGPCRPFPPHGWSAPGGHPLLLRKQPIWAAGGTPHVMPAEQGLPWHPVDTGLAGQAIPCVVAAPHVHALPSPTFWVHVPTVLVASPASLPPSSLSAALALVPPGVAPTFCVAVLLLPLFVGAPGCPLRIHSCHPPPLSKLRKSTEIIPSLRLL